MIEPQATPPNEAATWLELANGGGLMLREAAAAPSLPRYVRHRRPKQLEGCVAAARTMDL